MICAVFLLSSYFGYFQKEAYFPSARLGTCVFFLSILMNAFRHFTFASEYEVMFAFTKLLKECPPSLLLPYFLLAPSLTSFIVNSLHLEDSDGLITVQVSAIDIREDKKEKRRVYSIVQRNTLWRCLFLWDSQASSVSFILNLDYYFSHLQIDKMIIMAEHSSLKYVYIRILKTSRNLTVNQSVSKPNSFQ